MYVFINTKLVCTVHIHILCRNKLLFWMQCITINHLTALIIKPIKKIHHIDFTGMKLLKPQPFHKSTFQRTMMSSSTSLHFLMILVMQSSFVFCGVRLCLRIWLAPPVDTPPLLGSGGKLLRKKKSAHGVVELTI